MIEKIPGDDVNSRPVVVYRGHACMEPVAFHTLGISVLVLVHFFPECIEIGMFSCPFLSEI